MKVVRLLVMGLLLSVSGFAQNLPDPVLRGAQLPMYPPLAELARVSGDVKASFVIDETGAVTSVNVNSANDLLSKATQENIHTWKFILPKDVHRTEWRFETTFHYRLTGIIIGRGPTGKLTVTLDSFRDVEVVAE
jgi:TonB family protein